MLVETDRIIPITRLQKEPTQSVRELSETGEPIYIYIYILKNNNMIEMRTKNYNVYANGVEEVWKT